MISSNPDNNYDNYIDEKPLDTLQASLLILITQYTLQPQQQIGETICKYLQELCQHTEMMFFPEQHIIYNKMLQLWAAKTYTNKTSPEQAVH